MGKLFGSWLPASRRKAPAQSTEAHTTGSVAATYAFATPDLAEGIDRFLCPEGHGLQVVSKLAWVHGVENAWLACGWIGRTSNVKEE